MRISDWSSDVCSSDLDKDIYTPKLVIHFFDQCFGIDLLSDIRPTEDNGYSEILLYLGACDGAGLFVNFRDRDGCALARKPSSRAVTKSSSPARDNGDLTLESLDRKSTRLNSSH